MIVSSGFIGSVVWAAIVLPFAWLLLDGARWLVRAHRRGMARLRTRRSVRRHPAGSWRQFSHVRIVP
jgi:hypothetical protein